MILGFAHLTFGSDDLDAGMSHWVGRGWRSERVFRHVKSAREKLPLLSVPSDFHDLAILGGTPMIEVVAHEGGAVAGRSRIRFDSEGGLLCVGARDPLAETRFFRDGLGFEEAEGGAMRLRSIFPQWSLALSIIEDEDAPLDPPLDLAGLTCLAFYSTAPEGDADRLAARAAAREITPSFQVELDDRKMSALMLRSPEGTIVELIKVQTQS